MTGIRIALVVIGVSIGGFGAILLWGMPTAVLVDIAIWTAAGVILHDFVFAPACVAVGVVGRRLLPRRWWSPLAIAGLCSVVLVALAIPVYDRPGARPDNGTVLDRDYHDGLWGLLALVWAVTAIYLMLSAVRLARRRARTPRAPATSP